MDKNDRYYEKKEVFRNTGRKDSKSKPGHKFKPIDWELVKASAEIQCTMEEIAGLIGVSHDTLERACEQVYGKPFKELRLEWADGGKCSLRRKQWLLADKSASMAIFLGKQMLGQRDNYDVKHTGAVQQEIVHYGDKPAKPWKDEQNSPATEGENSGI